MKNHLKLIIFLFLTFACGKDKIVVLPENITVTTIETAEISTNQAKAKGDLKMDNKVAIKSYGHCWSATIAEPTPVNGSKTDLGPTETTTNFVSELKELKTNTTYFVRAYAFTQSGTYYGKVLTFKTTDLRAPIVTTTDGINIGTTTAGAKGQVTDLGTGTVTGHGHVISATNQNPTIADTKIDLGAVNAVPKDFESNFSNLKANTLYYTRAFATSNVGTSYGKAVTFTTKSIAPPIVETQDIGSTTSNSSIIYASLNSIGGEAISQHGICWSATNKLPDLNDQKNQLGSASAAKNFNATLNSLSPNTTYYVRAYATNSGGTAFGKVLTLKTNEENVNIAGQFWYGIYKNGPTSGFDQSPQANGILFNADGSFDFYSIIGFEKVGTYSIQGRRVNLFSEKYGINSSLEINGNVTSNIINNGRTLLGTLEKNTTKFNIDNSVWELKIVNDDGAVAIQTLEVKGGKFSLGASASRSNLVGDVAEFYNTVYFVVTNSKTSYGLYFYIYQNAAGTQLMKGAYLTNQGLYETTGTRK
jgi:hypothetical protein